MLSAKTEAKIEALLFYMSEPVKIKRIADILRLSIEELESYLDELEISLHKRGVSLVRSADEIALATSPEFSELIELVKKEELSRDLGKAGIETLGIIVYKGPVSRSEIDYIRGVNSTYIVRHLTVRGLVNREAGRDGKRAYLYSPSIDLLKYLGISKISEMPEYENFKEEMSATMLEEGGREQIGDDA
jgi:segregation and condensation protein B